MSLGRGIAIQDSICCASVSDLCPLILGRYDSLEKEKKVKEQGGITGLLHTDSTEHLRELPLCWIEVSSGCPHGSTHVSELRGENPWTHITRQETLVRGLESCFYSRTHRKRQPGEGGRRSSEKCLNGSLAG